MPLYAVPAGYTGSYADVYPHNVPTDAKDIQIAFVDAATGEPAPAQAVPGPDVAGEDRRLHAARKATVLHVHIDITGTGYGKPDEHSVNWKVVVTWSC